MATLKSDDILVIIPGEDGGIFLGGKSAWQPADKSMMAQVLDEAPEDVIEEVIMQLKSRLPASGPLTDRPPSDDGYRAEPPTPREATTLRSTVPDRDGSRDYDGQIGAMASAG